MHGVVMAAGLLPAVIERFSLRYPKVKLDVLPVNTMLRGIRRVARANGRPHADLVDRVA